MPAVLIPPNMLRPAPVDLAGVTCSVCSRTTAKWEIHFEPHEGDVAFLCSSCVIYASPFSPLISESALAPLLAATEETLGRALTRAEDGRLTGPDADRIVFSVVAVSNSKLRKGPN